MYCNVLVTRPFNDAFTYKIGAKQKVQIGSVVSVSFGKKDDQLGIVTEKINNQETQINESALILSSVGMFPSL